LLSALLVPIVLVPLADSLFGWGLFGAYGRKVQGAAMAIGLLWFIFVAPTPAELEEMKAKRRASHR
jgi:hypothetical protein